MTLTALLAGLASLATVVGGITYIFKYSSWATQRTQAQKNQDATIQNKKDEDAAREDGRPH